MNHSLFVVKKVLKVSIIKIRSLFVSLSVPQFHRETTLRTPRELPETAKTEKVRLQRQGLKHDSLVTELQRELLLKDQNGTPRTKKSIGSYNSK